MIEDITREIEEIDGTREVENNINKRATNREITTQINSITKSLIDK